MFFNNEKQESLDILETCCDLPINNNSYWWVRQPQFALKNINLMNNNTGSCFVSDGNKLIWVENITNTYGATFAISIETGSNYPHTMPTVKIISSSIDYKRDKHIFGDGSLCLLEPHDYHPNMTILDFRNLACAFCWAVHTYTETGFWPAAEAD